MNCCAFSVALVGTTPLACLAAIIDGPLIGFVSAHTPDNALLTVQRELPPILAGNKRRYASRLGRVVSEHIDLAFGG